MKTKNFNFILIFLIAIVAIFKLGLIASFKDTGWEPDSYMHYLQLDTVYENFPNNAFDNGLTVWARPIFKFLYGIPVSILPDANLSTIQIINLLVFSLSAFVLAKIVQQLFKSRFLSIISAIFLMLGFLSFKSSISDLTEPLFTFLLVLGYWFLISKNNMYLASLFIGLSVLARFEGIFFIGIYCVWLVYYYRNTLKSNLYKILKLWITTLLPFIVWNTIGFLHTGIILYLFDRGYPTNSIAAYGSGSWLYYPIKFLTHEPIVTILFILGSILLIKKLVVNKAQFLKSQNKTHDQKLLSLSFALLFLLSQIITWKFGMFGSAGLMRYFVGIMPFMIIVGIEFIVYVRNKFNWQISSRRPTPLFILSILIIAQTFILIIHFFGLFGLEKKWIRLEFPEQRQAGIWLKENTRSDELIASDRPEVVYYANRDLTNSRSWGMDFYKSDNANKGIFVWSESWTQGFGVERDMPKKNGFSEIKSFGSEIVIWRR